ncbi:MAG: putative Ig domain-containing protein [Methanosarcinaceae archaeon]|nr:putative Ig domain-containing protein [Methanosarcinaceae archaeon]
MYALQKNVKNVIVIFFVLSLVAGMSISSVSAAADSPEDTEQYTLIGILPSKSVVAPGEEFYVNISVEPGTAINGAQLDLLFDGSRQSVLNTVEGDLFNRSYPTIFYSGTVGNNSGYISNIYSAILGQGTESCPGTMVTVAFEAGNVTGHAAMNLSNVVVSNADSNATGCRVNGSTVLIDSAPVLPDLGPYSIGTTETLSFTLTAADPDNDMLAYTATGLPSGATLDGDSGQFSWTPAEGQEGTYVLKFQASDGYLQDVEYVTVTVNSNHPPVITNFVPADGTAFKEGEVININCDAYDPDGDALSYAIKINDVPVSSTAGYVWKTDLKSSGSYVIEVMVSDGTGEVSASRTITILNMHPRWDIIKDRMADILGLT